MLIILQVARTVTIRAWGDEAQLRPVDKTMASAIAGSAAGAVAGLGRKFKLYHMKRPSFTHI